MRFAAELAGKATLRHGGEPDPTNSAPIVQWQFGNQGNDQWLPTRQSDGSYVFTNRHSGLVLDNPAGANQGIFQMDQWGANPGSNQRFNVIGR